MNRDENRAPDDLYDVVVIGGGPAGLTAALYLARAQYRVLVVEKEQFGGQITITNEVVNYPGVSKTGGKELTETMQRQAEAFGAEFLLAEATEIQADGDIRLVKTTRGSYRCFGIVIATGAHPRSVGFQGEERYKGRGVAYCATCDGEFFAGKEIFVVGGGFAAAEESVFLTKFAKHVTVLVREDDFTCAAAVAEPARHHEKITVLFNTEVEAVSGENGLTYMRYRNNKTGKVTEYRAREGDTFGVFVFAGYSPDTALVKELVDLDENGYVVTAGGQKTSRKGIYAAGDVCIKPLRQVVTATGDGALAATELEKYVATMQQKTNLRPRQPRPAVDRYSASAIASEDILTEEMQRQLTDLFSRMNHCLTLRLVLDNRSVSSELEELVTKVCALSDKLRVSTAERNGDSREAPCVRVFRENGEDTGLAFHGVPGGHEFTSFVLGLYNAAGPGQPMDPGDKQRVQQIETDIDMKILVSLSCTMCPDLVTACQRLASLNSHIRAEVFDVRCFEELAKKYSVMSVPCLVINNDRVYFGKKTLSQVLDLIEK